MIDAVGEIERVLAGPPSQLAFRALCAALGRAGSPAELVVRCEQGLTEWPDETREAPWSWLAALDDGYAVPGWSLVRSLALKSGRIGTADLPLPDPQPQVTRLDLGYFAGDQVATVSDTLSSWSNLRVLKTELLTERDAEAVAALAANPELARLESLDLIDVSEDLSHFTPPPFRPPADRQLRLRHAGLQAPDFVHLLRSGIVPDLRSAAVRIETIEEARELAACSQLAQLEKLSVGFRCGRNGKHSWDLAIGNVIPEDDAACAAFFANAELKDLRELTIVGASLVRGFHGLGAEGLDAVVASGLVSRLTALSLNLLPMGDTPVVQVVEALDRERIESLTLHGLALTDVTAEGFTGTYSALRNLDLRHNFLTESGAQHLAHDVDLPALERLDLSGDPGGSPYYGRSEIQPIGDAGAVAWASSHNAVNLTELHLAATGITPAAIPELLNTGQLEILNVSYNQLSAWPVVERLPGRCLDLEACNLNDDDLTALAAAEAQLDSLNLAYNSIGSAKALAAWSVVPGLWELNLHDSHLDDDGLTELGAAATSLLELDLEQDCWKLDQRASDEPLPPVIADPAAFPNLDAIFLGEIDEYHGARYSAGYPPSVREQLGPDTRPVLRTFLNHLEMEEEVIEPDTLEGRAFRAEHDFRRGLAGNRIEAEAEARAFARELRG
ncbi:hypothetical protein GCM10029976_051420 [Kribbella albertanoniae]|uniref:Leucine-rich repeat domain-containing protein n=1 Tax=Kribbella albertanoniae TaxID=1266829 RepID=A0A4R4PW63_9ACTN|nr:hypothetical protein [Kribbella albertanoniae]TDC26697.1 hypothetical protein E1261_21985 [Kribbella albertanoniae]